MIDSMIGSNENSDILPCRRTQPREAHPRRRSRLRYPRPSRMGSTLRSLSRHSARVILFIFPSDRSSADDEPRLCRVYVLLNAKHGVNEADKQMLRQLDDKVQSGGVRWTLQAIITKADLVSLQNQRAAIEGISTAIFENAPTCLPPIVTASLKSNGLGVDDVRRSIVEACNLASSQR